VIALPRWIDVVAAVLALVVLSPLLAVLGLVVLLGSGRPVLYRQVRMGKDGRPFHLLKYRTMAVEADRASRLTVGVDPRVTRVGGFLRSRRLDELPQLLNVLRGDMALVGARPEVPEYRLPDLPEQVEVLRHRPGLTDPASLAFRDEAELLARAADPDAYYRTALLPAKVRMSADYLRRRTARSDVAVLLRTTWCLVAPSTPAPPTPGPTAGTESPVSSR
jgi:lipopolysaccharide/colanic/teichoic acid biosynthesis glycosyltransferase